MTIVGDRRLPLNPWIELEASHLIPLAILGDSDSHSYHDTVRLNVRRGGDEYYERTFQWTEILQRLRGSEVDLGRWGEWGTGQYVAALRRGLGWSYRTPAKQDYEFNFAISGARCENLTQWITNQLAPLESALKRAPRRWERGIVLIRIGINDLGTNEIVAAELASRGLDPTNQKRVHDCVLHIRTAVERIRRCNSQVRIALVGIFEEPDAHPEQCFSSTELANLRTVLDYYDQELASIAANTAGVAFIEDRSWWKEAWGSRDIHGVFFPRSLTLGGPRRITNTRGNHPTHAVLADGHAGTVANGLFLQHLVSELNRHFHTAITPISHEEICRLVDPTGDLGIAAPRRKQAGPTSPDP